MDPGEAAPRRPLTTGRRLYRGVVFALLVGFVGAAMGIVPAMFVQSVFIGESQRCEALEEQELALYGEVRTTCVEDVADSPTWLPPILIVGGGVAGLLGGFGYGFVSPKSAKDREAEGERPWLPF